MEGSIESSRSVSFLYLISHVLFQSIHTQHRFSDARALLDLRRRKHLAEMAGLDVAFPLLSILEGVWGFFFAGGKWVFISMLICFGNWTFEHDHRLSMWLPMWCFILCIIMQKFSRMLHWSTGCTVHGWLWQVRTCVMCLWIDCDASLGI